MCVFAQLVQIVAAEEDKLDQMETGKEYSNDNDAQDDMEATSSLERDGISDGSKLDMAGIVQEVSYRTRSPPCTRCYSLGMLIGSAFLSIADATHGDGIKRRNEAKAGIGRDPIGIRHYANIFGVNKTSGGRTGGRRGRQVG